MFHIGGWKGGVVLAKKDLPSDFHVGEGVWVNIFSFGEKSLNGNTNSNFWKFSFFGVNVLLQVHLLAIVLMIIHRNVFN
jgi:hypothetical protein